MAGEKLFAEFGDRVPYVVLRCPPIILTGSVGLLSIQFDFIRENHPGWDVQYGACDRCVEVYKLRADGVM